MTDAAAVFLVSIAITVAAWAYRLGARPRRRPPVYMVRSAGRLFVERL